MENPETGGIHNSDFAERHHRRRWPVRPVPLPSPVQTARNGYFAPAKRLTRSDTGQKRLACPDVPISGGSIQAEGHGFESHRPLRQDKTPLPVTATRSSINRVPPPRKASVGQRAAQRTAYGPASRGSDLSMPSGFGSPAIGDDHVATCDHLRSANVSSRMTLGTEPFCRASRMRQS